MQHKDEADYLWEMTANLAGSLGPCHNLPQELRRIEKENITIALVKNNNVIARAAKDLGISRERLHHRIKKLEILV